MASYSRCGGAEIWNTSPSCSKNSKDKMLFKVPSLRNLKYTIPYMHDGRFATLEEVIDHYNNEIDSSSTLDRALLATRSTGLRLSDEDKRNLIAFLKTLTDASLANNSEYFNPFPE